MNIDILKKFISNISLISYQIFLFQHITIKIIIFFFPEITTDLNYFFVLLLYIIITLIFSFLLYFCSLKLIQTRIFNDFENWILNNELYKEKKNRN
jgi:peptidoglycan/LPS O-acetylase OafA/YrhL